MDGHVLPDESPLLTLPSPVQPPSDALAHDLYVACLAVSRHARFDASSTLAPHQFNALAWVEAGIDSAGVIAEKERVSAPSMSRTVAGLAERGLLTRQEDPDDGRRLLLAVTDEGREVLAQVRAERYAWMRGQLAACTDAERATLADAAALLTRMVTR